MPTRRGWEVAAGGVGVVLLGRALGLVELYVVGTAALCLVAAAAAWARLNRFEVEARRALHPPRVHVGGDSRVELSVWNRGRGRSPVLLAVDPLVPSPAGSGGRQHGPAGSGPDGGQQAARFQIPPLDQGERAQAAYHLPTQRRGVFGLGPLQLELRDPFGLASLRVEAAGRTQLTVLPRVDAIPAPPHTPGHDPHAGADHPTFLGPRGEDFYALRPYQVGDDLRRVHWPSTARRDDLMIRQDELPWQGRATVVLDLRRPVHTPASLELAVSAAASVVAATEGGRSLVRLVDSEGGDTGYVGGTAPAQAILERLARAAWHSSASLGPALARLRNQPGGGALVMVTTAAATDADLGAMARLGARFPLVVVVAFERSAYDPAATSLAAPPRALPQRVRAVRVTASVPFAPAWTAAIGNRSRPGPAGLGRRRQHGGSQGAGDPAPAGARWGQGAGRTQP